MPSIQPARRRTAIEAVKAVEAVEAVEIEAVSGEAVVVERRAYVPPPLPPVDEAADEAMMRSAVRRASDTLSPTTPMYQFSTVAGRLLKVVRVTRTNNGFEGIVLEAALSDGTRIRVSSTSSNLRNQFREIPDGPLDPPITGRAVLVESRAGQPAHALE